jgi:hypothetical protein
MEDYMSFLSLKKKNGQREEAIPEVKTLKDYQNRRYYQSEKPISRVVTVLRRLVSRVNYS